MRRAAAFLLAGASCAAVGILHRQSDFVFGVRIEIQYAAGAMAAITLLRSLLRCIDAA